MELPINVCHVASLGIQNLTEKPKSRNYNVINDSLKPVKSDHKLLPPGRYLPWSDNESEQPFKFKTKFENDAACSCMDCSSNQPQILNSKFENDIFIDGSISNECQGISNKIVKQYKIIKNERKQKPLPQIPETYNSEAREDGALKIASNAIKFVGSSILGLNNEQEKSIPAKMTPDSPLCDVKGLNEIPPALPPRRERKYSNSRNKPAKTLSAWSSPTPTLYNNKITDDDEETKENPMYGYHFKMGMFAKQILI